MDEKRISNESKRTFVIKLNWLQKDKVQFITVFTIRNSLNNQTETFVLSLDAKSTSGVGVRE